MTAGSTPAPAWPLRTTPSGNPPPKPAPTPATADLSPRAELQGPVSSPRERCAAAHDLFSGEKHLSQRWRSRVRVPSLTCDEVPWKGLERSRGVCMVGPILGHKWDQMGPPSRSRSRSVRTLEHDSDRALSFAAYAVDMRSVTWASSAIAQSVSCLGQLSISGPRRTSTNLDPIAWVRRLARHPGDGHWQLEAWQRPSAQPLRFRSIDRRHARLSAGFSACASTFGQRSSCRQEHHVPRVPYAAGVGLAFGHRLVACCPARWAWLLVSFLMRYRRRPGSAPGPCG